MGAGSRRVLLLGATGTIGRATLAELRARRHDVVPLVRPGAAAPDGARPVTITDRAAVAAALAGERFDSLVSCMASRTGTPRDAWAVDFHAHAVALEAALSAGIADAVLLSALCVQRPRLAFQHAKLAFEEVLAGAGIRHAIVRPTAFFKSLSGQVERVRSGRPYLLFGDGRLTATKPISDRDLARYLADCLEDETRDGILPIGGPGPAFTPREQGERLFALLGRPPRFRSVPPAMLKGVAGALGAASRLSPRLADKAELARIGHYYATESMLVLDPATGRYDEAATPSTGGDTLFDHYARLLSGEAADDRGAHKIF
jgi:divinyl chlorophyllide a 8-vinyl-reductase